MSKLLVHFIADFLRDEPTAANQFGETLRCAVLDAEIAALTAYGLSQQQRNILLARKRKDILQAVSDEIGAVMDELDWGTAGLMGSYPQGGVHIRDAKVLYSTGTTRTVVFRGTGLELGSTVQFTPKGGGGAVAGAVQGRTCEKDVWQRLFVTAALPAGAYTAKVTRATVPAHGTFDLDVV